MADESSHQRTEPATPRLCRRAREEGRVARFIPRIAVLWYPEVAGLASAKTAATVKGEGLMGLAAQR